ncbi:MAG TPA: hypothetical protein VGF92_15825 [Stellaceae bacterium]|jgi:hypothetical protein
MTDIAFVDRPWRPVAAPIGTSIRRKTKAILGWLATVFVNGGTAIITNRIIQAGTAPKNIGWGVGTTPAAVTDTALQTESAPTTSGGRTVGTESRTTVTVSNDNYQIQGTITAVSTLAITEHATFDNVTAGNMLIHSVGSAVNVNSGDSIQDTFGLKQVAA